VALAGGWTCSPNIEQSRRCFLAVHTGLIDFPLSNAHHSGLDDV
jgi:hypothetical protein